ncbi:hypothetical protein ABPG77_000342, partial [Micractinium sp. CCAP 211/92]
GAAGRQPCLPACRGRRLQHWPGGQPLRRLQQQRQGAGSQQQWERQRRCAAARCGPRPEGEQHQAASPGGGLCRQLRRQGGGLRRAAQRRQQRHQHHGSRRRRGAALWLHGGRAGGRRAAGAVRGAAAHAALRAGQHAAGQRRRRGQPGLPGRRVRRHPGPAARAAHPAAGAAAAVGGVQTGGHSDCSQLCQRGGPCRHVWRRAVRVHPQCGCLQPRRAAGGGGGRVGQPVQPARGAQPARRGCASGGRLHGGGGAGAAVPGPLLRPAHAAPVTGDADVLSAELAPGLGEILASGTRGSPWRLEAHKSTSAVTATAFANFSRAFLPPGAADELRASNGAVYAPPSSTGGIGEGEGGGWHGGGACPADHRPAPATSAEVREGVARRLLAVAAVLEDEFGAAQDVEGCFVGNQLYVVQTRPQP